MTTAEEFRAHRKKGEKEIAISLFGAASDLSRAKSYLFYMMVLSGDYKSKKWHKFYAELDLLLYHLTQDLETISDKVNGRSR